MQKYSHFHAKTEAKNFFARACEILRMRNFLFTCVVLHTWDLLWRCGTCRCRRRRCQTCWRTAPAGHLYHTLVKLAEGRRQLATYTTYWSDLLKDGASWPPIPQTGFTIVLNTGTNKERQQSGVVTILVKKCHRKRDVQYGWKRHRHCC
jgi:hypothetical protein